MRKELLKGLTEEQIAKVNACKSRDELLAFAKGEGIELSEELLESVSGGYKAGLTCPKCGSDDTTVIGNYSDLCECNNCGYRW